MIAWANDVSPGTLSMNRPAVRPNHLARLSLGLIGLLCAPALAQEPGEIVAEQKLSDRRAR